MKKTNIIQISLCLIGITAGIGTAVIEGQQVVNKAGVSAIGLGIISATCIALTVWIEFNKSK